MQFECVLSVLVVVAMEGADDPPNDLFWVRDSIVGAKKR